MLQEAFASHWFIGIDHDLFQGKNHRVMTFSGMPSDVLRVVETQIARNGDNDRAEWFRAQLMPEIQATAADLYCRLAVSSEVVAVTLDPFEYLFDLVCQRAILACGVITAKCAIARDKSRMAGHPNAAGAAYDRGHLIPHSGGGGLDMNLVLQLAKANRGPFRRLERRAVGHPGSFYLVHLLYARESAGQIPDEIEQALVPGAPGAPALCSRFDNRTHTENQAN